MNGSFVQISYFFLLKLLVFFFLVENIILVEYFGLVIFFLVN